GGISAPLQSGSPAISFNLFPGGAEQRPHHSATSRWDAGQPSWSGASHEIEKHCLHLVTRMMTHRNPLGADPVRHLLKQPVAGQPPSFLDPALEPPGNRAYPGAAYSN